MTAGGAVGAVVAGEEQWWLEKSGEWERSTHSTQLKRSVDRRTAGGVVSMVGGRRRGAVREGESAAFQAADSIDWQGWLRLHSPANSALNGREGSFVARHRFVSLFLLLPLDYSKVSNSAGLQTRRELTLSSSFPKKWQYVPFLPRGESLLPVLTPLLPFKLYKFVPSGAPDRHAD